MQSHSPPPSDAELARYLARDCSGPEIRRIDEWLAHDESHVARLNAVREIWKSPVVLPPVNVDALWSRVRSRTTRPAPSIVSSPTAILPRRAPDLAVHSRFLGSMAAVVLVAISLSTVMERGGTLNSSPAPSGARGYYTARGEHAMVQLLDGSRVTLAPLSTLRILPGFGERTRELSLEGEAMLDVVHDSTRPFRVYVGAAVAEDIGTRFDIRGYADEGSVTVAVAEGAVLLGRRPDSATGDAKRAAEGVLIRGGGLGRLDEHGRIASRDAAKIGEYFGWANDTLVFDATPMDDVRRSLERWYHVQIRIDDAALRARRVTARFDRHAVRAVIDALATTLDASAEWKGDVVTLVPRG